MKTDIGITEKNRKAVSDSLSKLLADEFVLYTKTRNAHWNVQGQDFFDKHKFFEMLYEQSDSLMDRVAERIRQLGATSPATLKSFLSLTKLKETDGQKNDSLFFIEDLLNDHETIIKEMRDNITPYAEKYKDSGTSDFITGLMEEHEKIAWLLRAHFLQK
ncbi:starvation-inducible DNA-binding protein [Flavobacteriaceae bacterium MAR_2010_188]|nr:starvation-inducible DNA-binding protein [Flavobacteriaceae bacterium MAR_2010_188]